MNSNAFSFNNKKVKNILIAVTLITCVVGVVGAFFKIQPVYYTGMGCIGIMLVLNIIAFLKSLKEDKEDVKEIKENSEEEKDI